MTTLPVVVAGAGIAGLAAALALARRGIPVEIVERAAEFAEIGAGLQLSPNAVHALDRLGLKAAVAAVAVRPGAVRLGSVRRGGAVARVPLGEDAARRHGAPYFLVARPDLQAVLVAAVRREPLARLVTAATVLASRDGVDDPRGAPSGPVRVRTTAGDLDARLLVGADGVESAVRRAIGGAAAAATGKVAFRATAPAAAATAVNHAGDVHAWMAPRAHLVHYPVRGGARVNLVAVVDAAADERETGAIDWNHAAPAEAVLARFADFPPSVRTLLAAGQDWRRWPLATVDPSGPWRRGRAVLVGDAAHAMVPFLAQGAAMALEDAVVLADFVAGAGDVEAALSAYERARRPRVRRVCAAAARSGEIYHLAGAAAAARDLALSLAPSGLLLSSLDWLYGWRPAAG